MRASVLILVAAIATPVSADLLVMNDGSRLETRGEWTLRGNLVLFTLPNGTLGSLRANLVDLDASAVATAKAREAEQPVPVVPPKPREAVLTLTDDDVAKAPYVPPAPPEGGSGDDAAPATAGGAEVAVESWQQEYDIDLGGLRVSGIVQNTGTAVAGALRVMVEVYGEDGSRLAETPAELGGQALAPGRTVGFTATFPGVSVAGSVKFQVTYRALEFGATAPSSDPATPPPSE